MNCRDIDGMLVERPPASPFSAEVEDHVRGCMRCRALVSALGTFAPGAFPPEPWGCRRFRKRK